MTYNNAVQPATLQDIFLNRVQYEQEDGPLPFATTPSIDKYLHALRARLQLGEASLLGLFAHSKQTNTNAGLNVDYTGFSGRSYMPFSRVFSLKADAKRYDIDARRRVRPRRREGGAGRPDRGQDLRAGVPDRRVGLRAGVGRVADADRADARAGDHPARFTFLRAGYMWNEIERKSYEVEKTTTNSLYVAGRSRFGKSANGRFRFQYDSISDPFLYQDAAIPQVLQPYRARGRLPRR